MALKKKKLKYIEVACEFCKKRFDVLKTQRNKGHGKYCSVDCRSKGSIGKSAWNKGKTFNRVSVSCEICSKVVNVTQSYMKHRTRRFCSSECRNYYFAQMPQYKSCIVCTKEIKDRMNGRRIYCSLECYWQNLRKIHPKVNNHSYITIRVGGKRVYEHRFVMEKKIGRKLRKTEIVHHKNGNKQDNRLENLEIISQSEHIKEHFSKVNWGKVNKEGKTY